MAASTGRPICWEYSVPLDTFPTVKNIYSELTEGFSRLTRKLKETDSPARNIPEKLLKVQSKMKLLIFSKDEKQITNFLSWNRFHSSDCQTHFEMDSVEKGASHAQKEDFLVIPIILVTENDIEKEEASIEGMFQSGAHILPFLKVVTTVLTFRPSSRFAFQRIMDTLRRTSPALDFIFSEKDAMFRGFISRKILNWLVQRCERTIEALQIVLQVLKKLPSLHEVDDSLNNTLSCEGWSDVFVKTFTFVDRNNQSIPVCLAYNVASSEEGQSYARQLRDHAIHELSEETIRLSFSELEVMREKSCFLQYLMTYFQSLMTGMIIPRVKRVSVRVLTDINSVKWRYDAVNSVVKQVGNEWQDCIRDFIYDEIRKLDLGGGILTEFIPKLQVVIRKATVHDEVPYETQIRLSRIPGVRSFGIEEKTFTVYVDSPYLKDDDTLTLIRDAVDSNYKIDRSCLLEWKEPKFHHRTGDLIKGEGCQCGMITVFAERLSSSDEVLQSTGSLYFLTCEHVAPKKEMRVFFSRCRNCENSSACSCEREELGINMYPFGIRKENPFDAVVDITCGIVHKRASVLCDKNVRGPHTKLSEMVDFSRTIEEHTGKTVLKWDCDEQEQKGTYCGVQYITLPEEEQGGAIGNDIGNGPKRVDIIRSLSGGDFGKEGESGALTFLLEERAGLSDLMSPAFVYLGQWGQTGDKFMCFRLQEGLECLAMEHNLKLRLCLENSRNTQATFQSLKRHCQS